MLGPVALAVVFAAPPAPLEIGWTAPEECPDGDALRERVLAQADLDEAGEGTLQVEGVIHKRAGQYVLRLRTVLGELSDEVELRDPSCTAVVDAAALIVVVSIEPPSESEARPRQVRTLKLLPPIPEPTAASPEPTAQSPGPVVVPLAEPPKSRAVAAPVALALGVGGQLEVGSLPGVTAGPRLSAELQWERASIAVFGFYGSPRRTGVVQDVSGLVQMGAGGVLGCGAFHPGELRVPLCGVLEAGALGVQSRGLDPRNRLTYLWAAVGAGGGVERRWNRVGVFAAAEALIPVRRAQVLVGEAALYEASWVSLRLVAGLKIFFATDSA